jgi:hypothetical protein
MQYLYTCHALFFSFYHFSTLSNPSSTLSNHFSAPSRITLLLNRLLTLPLVNLCSICWRAAYQSMSNMVTTVRRPVRRSQVRTSPPHTHTPTSCPFFPCRHTTGLRKRGIHQATIGRNGRSCWKVEDEDPPPPSRSGSLGYV